MLLGEFMKRMVVKIDMVAKLLWSLLFAILYNLSRTDILIPYFIKMPKKGKTFNSFNNFDQNLHTYAN